MAIMRDTVETLDFSDISDGSRLPPVHPGEVLLHDFIEPMAITQHALALSIAVPPRRINEIVHCKRAVSADTALRLARFFGTTPQFWTGLQAFYDTEQAKAKILTVLKSIPRFVPGARLSPIKQLVA